MKDLEETYGEKFFAKRNSLQWRAEIFCIPILEILQPRSVIDVGCAIGDFVKWFYDKGLDAWGIEGSTAARKYSMIPERMFYLDMRKPHPMSLPFDLAISIEVAEHIEPEYAKIYAKNLIGLSKRLLLTIAGPGEKGHSHVNLQPQIYWDNLFASLDYQRNTDIEYQLKEPLYVHKNNRWVNAIANHLYFYEAKKS